MNVNLSSGGYDIIASDDVFLFDDAEDLTIKVTGEDNFGVCVTIKFLNDASGERRISSEIIEDKLVLLCHNFNTRGTGMTQPMHIADINGKKVFLTIWAYLEGSKSPKIRSVKYTLFYEQ